MDLVSKTKGKSRIVYPNDYRTESKSCCSIEWDTNTDIP